MTFWRSNIPLRIHKSGLIGIFIAVFFYGLHDNLRGSVMPFLLQEFHLDFNQGGLFMLGTPIGVVVSAFGAGLLLKRVGFRPLFLLSAFCLLLGLGGFLTLHDLKLLWICLFILGLGMGSLQLLTNAALIQAFPTTKARILSFASIFFSAGATSAPQISLSISELNWGWRPIYWPLIFLACCYLALFLYPRSLEGHAHQSASQTHQIHLFHNKNFWIFLLLFLGYSGIEIGMGSWLVSFLQLQKSYNNAQSQNLFTLYLASLVLGRLIGGLYLDRLGLKRSLLLHLSFFSCFLFCFIHLDSDALFLPLSGLALSIFFPAATALASELFGCEAEKALGFAFALAGAGGILGLSAVGWLSAKAGLLSGMQLLGFLGLLLLILSGALRTHK